jgi:outer membrane protein OmpA-like peptidoglycan-associated protein
MVPDTLPYGQYIIKVPLKSLTREGTTTDETPVVLRNIEFESGSAKLLSSSRQELNLLHTLLTENPQVHIEIHGHTDNIGEETDNQILSEARARAVYDWLITKGIAASRLSFKGFGETRPIDTNETEEGRQENRRTEFVVR